MNDKKETYQICTVSWIVILIGITGLIIMHIFHIDIEQLSIRRIPCILYTLFGIYCPGCGGTRAVCALLRGNIFQSIYYHPVVMYTVVLYGWYLISNTIQWISREKLQIGTHFKTWYGNVAIVIIVINWIVRNVLLLGYGMFI